jgi:uncharacterized membrane protein YebE (DUF533 family)
MEQAEQTLEQKMQDQITQKLEEAFDMVVKDKNKYYQQNPEKIPSPESIKSLISSVALTNSAISGGASLVPGPWGMLAVIPELILVIKNQIGLIYDIAAAHGQKELITRELLAEVFISGMGTTTGSVLVVHGSKVLIKRASLRVFQKLIALLGGKITQQALKSAISKWLPGVGAAAMAAWTNYMTRQIGKMANEIFSKEIEQNDAVDDIELIKPIEAETIKLGTSDKSNEFYKIQILTNLAKIDGNVDESEIKFIATLIEKSELTPDEKIELTSRILSTEKKHEGLDAIAASPDDSIALLADLTALAKIDDKFHITEKLYIKQVGKILNFSEADIEEVMSANP